MGGSPIWMSYLKVKKHNHNTQKIINVNKKKKIKGKQKVNKMFDNNDNAANIFKSNCK